METGDMPYLQGLSNNPYPEPNQINPIPIPIFLILSYILLPSTPSLPKGLFPVGTTVKILKEPLPSSILDTWPAHHNLLDLITLAILDERHKLWSSSLRSLFNFRFSFLSGPNIRIRTLFSSTLSLFSSLKLKYHVSQLYSKTSNVIVL